MDLVSAEYGWTDEQILDRTPGRLRQAVAAIHRRQWQADLAHRRLETAKLRAVCAYVAATIPLEEGAQNTMIDEAMRLALGPGTEPAGETPTHTPAPAPAPPGRPAGRVMLADLPDAPASVRVGQPSAIPEGARPVPLEKLGSLLGGGPR